MALSRGKTFGSINPTEGGELRAKPVFKTIRHNSLMEEQESCMNRLFIDEYMWMLKSALNKRDPGSKPGKQHLLFIFFS